jgi:hypothetical protein
MAQTFNNRGFSIGLFGAGAILQAAAEGAPAATPPSTDSSQSADSTSPEIQ